MIEHNPSTPTQSPWRPVNPLPIALYISGELIYELYDGDSPTVNSRSVGRDSSLKSKENPTQFLRLRRPPYRLAKTRSRVPLSGGSVNHTDIST
jgi:hypothetical protein